MPQDQTQPHISTPDGGCLGIVLRTGFGTTQGQLVRTMIFSRERVSANNMESFLFIGFLLIFAIAASWYVWVKGKATISLPFQISRVIDEPCRSGT
jgi:manganese-transporting P-type ATPase